MASSAPPSVSASAAPSSTASNPASTLPPPATTPVPQQSPGDINSTVPTEPQASRKPVKLDQTSKTGDGVSAELTSIKAIASVKARGAGEVTAPGLAITVKVTNNTSAALTAGNVVVTLTGSDDAPGNPMTAKPAKAMTGTLAAGKSATGVYVFTLAENLRKPVTVAVSISGPQPLLVFTGNAPS